MKKLFYHSFAMILAITLMLGCSGEKTKEQKNKFVLNGTIKGMSSGKILVRTPASIGNPSRTIDSAEVVNGKFILKGDYPEAKQLYLKPVGVRARAVGFWAENDTMTFTADAAKFREAKVSGAPFQDEFNAYNVLLDEMLSKVTKGEEYSIINAQSKARDKFNVEYAKNNPKSKLSAFLLSRMIDKVSPQKIEEYLAMLDKSLDDFYIVVEIRNKAKELNVSKKEVGFDEFMPNASNVTYKMDKGFKGSHLKGIKYLGMFSNNNVCAYTIEGKVQIIKPDGKMINSFDTKEEGHPSSVAVDENDNIYVFNQLMDSLVTKNRGRRVVKYTPKAVCSGVYDINGKKIRSLIFKESKGAMGARVIDGKILISSSSQGIIFIYDQKTTNLLSKMEGMRTCCSMIDFTVNSKKEVLVANLGAFRVNCYGLDGSSKLTFGSRGPGDNEFQGCCNPVSVASLSNGAIVTVEKDPTRVKVFSKEGAKYVEGVQEMVKGCAHIPMSVDGNDVLYLSSMEKGLFKCIPAK